VEYPNFGEEPPIVEVDGRHHITALHQRSFEPVIIASDCGVLNLGPTFNYPIHFLRTKTVQPINQPGSGPGTAGLDAALGVEGLLQDNASG
jgi:hypothetical protein